MDVKQKKDFIIMNKFISAVSICILFFSCSKNSNNVTNTTFFPPVTVNLSIKLSLPYYAALTMPQGWMYLPGGYRGIILYNSVTNGIIAYDRACPVNTNDSCAFVNMDSAGYYLVCSKTHVFGPICTASNAGICGSKFLPDNGYPNSGPATLPLKQYVVRNDGGDNYTITN